MTTTIEPSVDELLLLQENQYHRSNFIFANIKPIGAERKNGQLSNVSKQSAQRVVHPIHTDFVQENNNFEMPSSTSVNSSTESSTMSVYDHFYLSSSEEPITQQINNELNSLTYHPFYNRSSSLTNNQLPQLSSHLIDNYNNQSQTTSSLFVQQKCNQSLSTQIHTVKPIPSFHTPQNYPNNRFFSPQSAQFNSRNPFFNNSQQTRSVPPVFTPPFQCTRERFQVNSIGRPILRGNYHSHLSQVNGFKTRR